MRYNWTIKKEKEKKKLNRKRKQKKGNFLRKKIKERVKACIFKIQALCWRSLKGSAALKYTCKRKISSDYNPDNKLKGKSNMTTNFHEKTTFHNNLKLNSDKKILQQLNGSQSDKHNQNQKFFLFLHLFCNNAISKPFSSFLDW